MSIAFGEFGGAYVLVCNMINKMRVLVHPSLEPRPPSLGFETKCSSMLQIPRKVPTGSVAVPGRN